MLTPALIRAWLAEATAALERAREKINALNVYPIPDSDTGTNSYFTVRDAAVAVDEAEPNLDVSQLLQVLAEGALLGARGNSGIIISTWFGGFARNLSDDDALADRFARAATAASEAVMDLQEGMAPRIAQDFATAFALATAGEAVQSGHLGEMLAHAVLQVRGELPALALSHPTLRAAGVIDSGSCAMLLVLTALTLQFLDPVSHGPLREKLTSTAWIAQHTATVAAARLEADPLGVAEGGTADLAEPLCEPTATAGPEYEVLALLRSADPDFGALLRPKLGKVGNSVSIVANADLWQVHVHGADPQQLLACFPAAALRQIRVHRLDASGLITTCSVVVVTGDWAKSQQYADAGANVLLAPEGRKIKHRHLVRALRDAAGRDVVVLVENGTAHSTRVAKLISGQVSAGPGISFWQDDAEPLLEILDRLAQQPAAAQE